MFWIWLLLSLNSSVCEIFVVTLTTTEEKNSIIISWDSLIKSDLSLANIACFFLSKPLKVLYEMINGVEVSESQDQQFAGRVQLDRDALREGRVTIHLSTVTEQDSGNYCCDVAADYDKNKRKWSVLDTGHFVLDVVKNKDGRNSDDSLSTEKFGLTPAEGAKHPPLRRQQDVPGDSRSVLTPIILVTVVAVLIVGSLLWLILPTSPIKVAGDKHEEVPQIQTDMKDSWIFTLKQIIIGLVAAERIQQSYINIQLCLRSDSTSGNTDAIHDNIP